MPQILPVLEEPLVSRFDPFPERDMSLPAQFTDPRDIQEFTRCSIGLAGIVDDLTLKPGDLGNCLLYTSDAADE